MAEPTLLYQRMVENGFQLLGEGRYLTQVNQKEVCVHYLEGPDPLGSFAEVLADSLENRVIPAFLIADGARAIDLENPSKAVSHEGKLWDGEDPMQYQPGSGKTEQIVAQSLGYSTAFVQGLFNGVSLSPYTSDVGSKIFARLTDLNVAPLLEALEKRVGANLTPEALGFLQRNDNFNQALADAYQVLKENPEGIVITVLEVLK